MGSDKALQVWTTDDFTTTTRPYDSLWALRNNDLEYEQAIVRMTDEAERLGIGRRQFASMWSAYRREREKASVATIINGQVKFDGQPIDHPIQTGEWLCDDYEIFKYVDRVKHTACRHPILISERLVAAESDTVRVRIAYKTRDKWDNIVVDRAEIASPQQIVKLANYGIDVTTETAKSLIAFLSDIELLNDEIIPVTRSVTRLGWLADGNFAPYAKNVSYDGEDSFKPIWNSMRPKGSFEKWRECIIECRQLHPSVKIAVSAVFAAPLMKRLGALSSFVHLWATTTTGKTMILRMATSGWANPEGGAYAKSFNATPYGLEQLAQFYNNAPIVLDELQNNRERGGGQKSVNIYTLTQGSSGVRGNKDGGLRRELTWNTIFLTSGEERLTTSFNAGGAKARVIDVYINDQVVDLTIGRRVSAVINNNYGHAGPKFISVLEKIGDEALEIMHGDFINQLMANAIQDKQCMTASPLLIADQILCDQILKTNDYLTVEELKPHLLTNDQVNTALMAFELLRDWVATNYHRFGEAEKVEQYGRIDGDNAYIIRTEFDKLMRGNGFDPQAVLAELANQHLIETTQEGDKRRLSVVKRVNSIPVRTIGISLDGGKFNENAF